MFSLQIGEKSLFTKELENALDRNEWVWPVWLIPVILASFHQLSGFNLSFLSYLFNSYTCKNTKYYSLYYILDDMTKVVIFFWNIFSNYVFLSKLHTSDEIHTVGKSLIFLAASDVVGVCSAAALNIWTAERLYYTIKHDSSTYTWLCLTLLCRVDLVVHSLKDLPTALPPGFTIGAVLK